MNWRLTKRGLQRTTLSVLLIGMVQNTTIAMEKVEEKPTAVQNLNTQQGSNEGGKSTEGVEASMKQHNIAWSFNTYAEPDFRAEKMEQFSPQTVTILEKNQNGWAHIQTYSGTQWVYLPDNRRFIEKEMVLYETQEKKNPVGTLSPQVVKVLEEAGDWLKIETWMGEKWINLADIRPSVVLDVPAYDQRKLGYPTGCEIISVSMMINYKTEADVAELVSKMPRAYDPNVGFRGNPKTKEGFTIFPQALVPLATEYVGAPQDMTGCQMEDLKEKLNDNIPIVVWINGLGFNVHAICLTGYDEAGFYYNDPWRGSKNTFITYDKFYKIWNNPIYDEVSHEPYSTRKALSYMA